MDLGNLSLERRSGAPSLAGKRVAAFIAVSAFLGISQSLLVAFLPPGTLPPLPPTFVPGIVAFCLGATLSIALLSFGRFVFVKEPYAFWLGTAFWLASLVGAAYLLSLQGFLPGARATSAYLFYLFFLVLLLPCVFFMMFPARALSLTGWPTLEGSSLVCLLVIAAIVVYAEQLPVIFLAPRPDSVSIFLPYTFFFFYLAAVRLHWVKFRRTQEPLIGYFLGFLSICLWTFSAVIHSYTVHDLSSLSYFLFPVIGCGAFYFVLLVGYLDLYRGLGQSLDQMALTHHLNTLVTGSLDLEKIYRTLSEEIRKLVPFDRMTISVFQSAERYRTVFDREVPLYGAGDRVSWIEAGSATRWVVDHGEPVVCEDLFQDDRFPSTRKRYGKVWVRSYVIFPLMVKGKVLGALNLASLAPHSYGKEELETLAPVVEVLSLAVENSTLYQETQRREEIQRLLKEVSQEITLLDLDTLLKKFTERVRQILKVDISNVRLIEAGVRRIVGVSGIDEKRLRATSIGSGRGASQWIVENRKPLAIADITESGDIPMGETTRSIGLHGYLGVPLFSRDGSVMGIVQALTYQPRAFSREETDLLEQLANGVAIALENGRLLDDLKSANRKLEESAMDQVAIREFLSDILFLDLDKLLQKMTDQAALLFNAEFAWLRLVDDEGRVRTRVMAGRKEIVEIMSAWPERRIGRRTGQMLETRKPIAVRDIADDADASYHGMVLATDLHGFLGAPLFSRDQKPLGVLFVSTRLPHDFSQREITLIEQFASGIAIAIENAALLDEARKKSEELSDAYQAKSDFLNTMAHELRTPLNVIIGTEQLLIEGFYGGLTEGQEKGLESIGRNADELLNLINGILDLVRLESRRVPVKVEEFALRGLMEELEASFAPLAREKGLGLRFEAGNGMKLRSDRSKVKEILQNLVGNAVKYTDRGGIGVWVDKVSDGGDGNEGVVFSVRDTGIGIKEEELEKIFEPFYMVEGVDRRKYPGSGLGLSIVKRMVELLGGVIAVESELGKGSTFKITFPSFPGN